MTRTTLFSLFVLLGLGLSACGAEEPTANEAATPQVVAPTPGAAAGGVELVTATEAAPAEAPEVLSSLGEGEQVMPNGLRILDEVVGEGTEATTGMKVSVHYTGTFLNGETFDSSFDRGQPMDFVLGQDAIIQGWHEGIVGMKVGGKRKLGVPAPLAYGEQGHEGGIEPNTPLLFTIELVDVQ